MYESLGCLTTGLSRSQEANSLPVSKVTSLNWRLDTGDAVHERPLKSSSLLDVCATELGKLLFLLYITALKVSHGWYDAQARRD